MILFLRVILEFPDYICPIDKDICIIYSLNKSNLLEALWKISPVEILVVQISPVVGKEEATDA